jgi:hypothetical protein
MKRPADRSSAASRALPVLLRTQADGSVTQTVCAFALGAFADQLDDDVGALYLRLARDAPAGFVEAPKDGIKVGRAAGGPAVQVDQWLVFPDAEGEGLLAAEQSGEGRMARVVNGEIKPIKTPTPEEVALN